MSGERSADDRVPVRFLLRSADSRGGVVHSTLRLAAALSKDHDVEVISVFRHLDEPPFARPTGVRMTYLEDRRANRRFSGGLRGLTQRALVRRPSRLVPRAERMHAKASLLTDVRLRRAIRAMRPGILITTRPALHVIAARLAPRGVAVIAQEHMNFDTRPDVLQHAIVDSAAGLAAVVVLTGRDRRDYRQAFDRVPRHQSPAVRCIPNAASWPPSDVSTARREHVVLAAGRLNHQKGFDRLIEAYAPLAAAFPHWRLEIYGEGADRAKLEKQIEAAGVRGSVALKGFTTGLQQQMGRAAVFALTSRYEGLPMVGIEALGESLPIVAFDCPRGPRELVDDGSNGFLVVDGDLEQFTSRLRSLMSDEGLRMRLGANARVSARSFDISRVAERWERLFAVVLAESRTTTLPLAEAGLAPADV